MVVHKILKGSLLIVIAAALLANIANAQFFVFENPLKGKAAPDFTLETLNSGKVKFSEFRGGQGAIVFFWATWCPHCRTQLEQLNKSQEQLKSQGIKVVLVDLGESSDVVRKFMEKKGISMEVFLDLDSKLADEYGIVGVPTFFFINKDGTVQSVEHQLPKDLGTIL